MGRNKESREVKNERNDYISDRRCRRFESYRGRQKIQVERLGFFHLCPQDTTSFECNARNIISSEARISLSAADTNERGCTSCK